MDVKVKYNYIKIYDSYQFSKIDFETCLKYIKENYDTEVFNFRSMKSMKREWAVHNFLYKMCLFRDRTIDVTFEIPMSKWLEGMYNVLGAICMLYID